MTFCVIGVIEILLFLFQPPIVIINITVVRARELEAKDADGKN